MEWRDAAASDRPRIVAWNRALQEDEGAEVLSEEAAAARLGRWLAGEYRAVVFVGEGEPVGYALFRPTDPDLKGEGGVYLRQFFVARERRRAGLGRRAFALLRDEVVPGRRIVLEVLASNPAGEAFWRSLGLEVYSTAYHTGGSRG